MIIIGPPAPSLIRRLRARRLPPGRVARVTATVSDEHGHGHESLWHSLRPDSEPDS